MIKNIKLRLIHSLNETPRTNLTGVFSGRKEIIKKIKMYAVNTVVNIIFFLTPKNAKTPIEIVAINKISNIIYYLLNQNHHDLICLSLLLERKLPLQQEKQ